MRPNHQNRHTLVAALLGSLATLALAEPAATLIFAPPGVQIIDSAGLFRPAKQGDVVQTGERVVTPANTISQLKLPDGSLVGLRPGSVLKIDLPPTGVNPSQHVMSLVQGTVRVVGSELMGQARPASLTLQTGQTTLKLNGADVESAMIRPDSDSSGSKPGGNSASGNPGNIPGSYTRLLVGSGSTSNGTTVEPLPVGKVSFVAPGSTNPTNLTSVAPSVFSSAGTPGLQSVKGGTVAPGQGSSNTGPVSRNTSTLTAPSPSAGPAFSNQRSGSPPPMFSPITTSQFPTSPGARANPGGSGTVTGPRLTPPPRPLANFQPPPPRPPPICRPNPVVGQPPICT